MNGFRSSGICRAVGVGMKWLMGFLVECYGAAPADLNAQIPQPCDLLLVQFLEVEADELWSFVGKKANPQWLWLALDARSRREVVGLLGPAVSDPLFRGGPFCPVCVRRALPQNAPATRGGHSGPRS